MNNALPMLLAAGLVALASAALAGRLWPVAEALVLGPAFPCCR